MRPLQLPLRGHRPSAWYSCQENAFKAAFPVARPKIVEADIHEGPLSETGVQVRAKVPPKVH